MEREAGRWKHWRHGNVTRDCTSADEQTTFVTVDVTHNQVALPNNARRDAAL